MDLGHVILLQSPILRVAAIWLEPQALTRDSLRFRKTGCALCPCNLAFTLINLEYRPGGRGARKTRSFCAEPSFMDRVPMNSYANPNGGFLKWGYP